MSGHRVWVLLTPFCIWLACGVASGERFSGGDLEELASWMTGGFSSQRQSEEDTSYYDIRLEMVRIWKDRSDGYWLYVEQALASSEARPYRQRVYRLSQLSHDLFQSRVYALENSLRFAGRWRDKSPLGELTPDSLTVKEGCAIVLRRSTDGGFVGNTVGDCCQSTLHGASYATSEVTVTDSLLTSWDRGFDSAGDHVWGPEEGPYRFDKVENYPLE